MTEISALTASGAKLYRGASNRVLATIAWALAGLCLLPMLAAVLAAMTGGTDTITHLWDTVLPGYTWTTVKLVVLVAIGSAFVGVGAAWL